MTTRLLYTVIPSQSYHKDETLRVLLDDMAEDLENLYQNGVEASLGQLECVCVCSGLYYKMAHPTGDVWQASSAVSCSSGGSERRLAVSSQVYGSRDGICQHLQVPHVYGTGPLYVKGI